MNASDEEEVDTPKVEETLSPAEAKEKKEKESMLALPELLYLLTSSVRFYRHKLQKGFLSRDTVPAEDEIKASSAIIRVLLSC